jgi:hypothetical protein
MEIVGKVVDGLQNFRVSRRRVEREGGGEGR